MEYNIILKDEVYDKIHTLMYNIDELNKGLELGGWLLGDWTIEGKEATLLLTDFIIPKQEVSKTEVDISPQSMTDTIKTVGIEQSNRIKAHWHIHPFGGGDTHWSGTDDEKIRDFMDPVKGREIFVFLLSSEDQIKARVVANFKQTNSFLGIEQTVRQDIDNIEVQRESGFIDESSLEDLREVITEKVQEIRYINASTKHTGEVDVDYNYSMQYDLQMKPQGLLLTLNKGFSDYVKGRGNLLHKVPQPSNVTTTMHATQFQWSNKKIISYPRLDEVLENRLMMLEDEFLAMGIDDFEYDPKYYK